MRRALAALLALAGLAGCGRDGAEAEPVPVAVAPEDTLPRVVRDTALEAAFRQAAAAVDGIVAVEALHLEGNVRASIGADVRLPLASVYKLPIAHAALRRVAPDDTLRVERADLAPGTTILAPGARVTVRALVERSLGWSDNTASDVLLRAAGGPEAVTREVRALGVEGVRVDRTMREVFADWRGIADTAGMRGWSAAEFERHTAAVPADARAEARAAFLADGRDTGTAAEVAALLAAVQRGEGVDAAAHEALLAGLSATVTGANRIRAGVPEGTPVASKTGTLGPLTHDAGIVTLPDGTHLVLAVLVHADAPDEARERVIAEVARAAWRAFAGDAGGAP